MAAERILIQTATPGWFIDPQNGGKKVRKTADDVIMTQDEYDVIDVPGVIAEETAKAEAAAPTETKGSKALQDLVNAVPAEPKPAKPAAEAKVLSTGKAMKTQTVEIQCAWVDPEHRTAKQEKILTGPKRDIRYDLVAAAADPKNPKSNPDGTKRVIAVQDAFQVKFTATNQEKYRREQRRRNRAAKKAAEAK